MRLHPFFSLPFQGKTLFLLCSMGLPIVVFADQTAPPVTPVPQTRAVVAPATPTKEIPPAPETKKESPAPAKEGSTVVSPKPVAKPNALPELPESAKTATNKTPTPEEKLSGTTSPPPAAVSSSATPTVTPPANASQNITPVAPEEPHPEPSRAKVLSESDEIGRSVRITFFDKHNKPTDVGQLPSNMESKTLGATGFASVKFDYDGDHKDEKPILWEFFDTEGNPVLTSLGYSKISCEHNKEGREVRRSYLGKHDEPVNTQFGFSSVKRTYDGTKRLTRETYYDKDNKIVNNSRLGYAIKNVAYVNNDKEEYDVTTFMDAQANPVKIGGAYKQIHGVSKSDPPLTIIQSYNNQNDALMNGPDGYALHITRPIDNSHNPKEAYLDELSQLTDGPEGFAQLVLTQEKGKNLYKLQYFDLAGVPVNNKALGWCYKIFRMSKDGEQKDAVFYNKSGNRVIINAPN